MDDVLREFLAETNENLARLEHDIVELERAPRDVALLNRIFRTIHTIKGTCGFLELERLERIAHASETVLVLVRERSVDASPAVVTSVLAAVDVIKNILGAIEQTGSEPAGDDTALIALLESVGNTSPTQSVPAPRSTLSLSNGDSAHAGLREAVMKTRLQPIGTVWRVLPRLVRNLANETGKLIELDLSGADLELDRQIIQAIQDPLMHMVRNSVDHGVESPAVRRAAGKPATGRIRLTAYGEAGHVVIEVSDDGAGLDAAKIRAKAIERGMLTREAAAALTEAELLRLIFEPGLSTADRVTNLSGRGVGMDVVRSNVERIGGVVELSSRPGMGTTIRVRIPLSFRAERRRRVVEESRSSG